MLTLPASWRPVLGAELEKPYFHDLRRFLAAERASRSVFPPEDDVLAAFEATPYDRVRVLLLGQDPYHDDGQAHGLAFSVRPGVRPPPSLVNMFKELKDDLGVPRPDHGCLLPWARQGVLLLNTVLTVRAHEAGSHRGRGWETFTDEVIRAVTRKADRVVFVLWGNHAHKKAKLVDAARHTVLKGVHPSPLSAKGGFFGSKPFSAVNAALAAAGSPPIDWHL